jgi:MFS family permease
MRTLASLRHRNYRLYWSGQMFSLVGTSMQTIGQAWLVLQMTQSAWQLGIVGALQALPILLFTLIGGVFADRWPKRRVLLCTQLAAMVQAFVLWALVATGTIQIWHMYVLALVLGIAHSLGTPVSRAFIVELVGREDLPNGIALNTSLSNLTRVVGPGIGGVIIAASGVTILFLLNALSFLAVLLGLALIRSRELYAQGKNPSSATRKSTWQSAREGLDYVGQTSAALWLVLVAGLALLFGSNFGVLLPLFATDVLHAGPTGFGFLSAATDAGALISSLWLASSRRKPTIRGVLIGTLIFGVVEAAFAVSRIYVLSVVLIALVGAAEFAFAAQSMTAIQLVTPDHLRGRVMSVQVLFFDGSLPLGYLLVGWLSALCGPSTALLVGASLSLIVAGAGWIWRGPAELSFASA